MDDADTDGALRASTGGLVDKAGEGGTLLRLNERLGVKNPGTEKLDVGLAVDAAAAPPPPPPPA